MMWTMEFKSTLDLIINEYVRTSIYSSKSFSNNFSQQKIGVTGFDEI